MKRLLVTSLLLCASVCAARAQENVSAGASPATNVAENFSATSGARVPLVKPFPQAGPVFIADARDLSAANLSAPATLTTALAIPMDAADPASAKPSPEPAPRFIYSSRDDYRWQLGLGVSFERFRSSIYSASAVGSNTSLSYFLNDWFGAEGNVSTFFAPTIWGGEHIKLVNYGVGPRITWRRPRWEPWLHALVGGTHALPQTAGHSQNGFSLQAGGGADYRFAPRLSVRLEVDYVATHLFGQWQNNLQAAAGLVFHF
ncbi:MAG: outer membrane beta-barrel protein [Acidobacteriota bacterium]|nr:outer membrane beta-barrel protein [Acidobacteriota bacterium]